MTVLGKALRCESDGPAKDLTPETQSPSKMLGRVSYLNNSSTRRVSNAFRIAANHATKTPRMCGAFRIYEDDIYP
jgi:hypothetical protein